MGKGARDSTFTKTSTIPLTTSIILVFRLAHDFCLDGACRLSLDQDFFHIGIDNAPTDKPIQLAVDLNPSFPWGQSTSQPSEEQIALYNVQPLWL